MSKVEVPGPSWAILPSCFKAIRFSFEREHTASIAFRVYSVCSHTENAGDQSGRVWELMHMGAPTPLSEWAGAFCEIDGALKWDGCINWQTNPDCMMHGCGSHHVEELKEIFSAVYHIGQQRMQQQFYGQVPPLPADTIQLEEAE